MLGDIIYVENTGNCKRTSLDEISNKERRKFLRSLAQLPGFNFSCEIPMGIFYNGHLVHSCYDETQAEDIVYKSLEQCMPPGCFVTGNLLIEVKL